MDTVRRQRASRAILGTGLLKLRVVMAKWRHFIASIRLICSWPERCRGIVQSGFRNQKIEVAQVTAIERIDAFDQISRAFTNAGSMPICVPEIPRSPAPHQESARSSPHSSPPQRPEIRPVVTESKFRFRPAGDAARATGIHHEPPAIRFSQPASDASRARLSKNATTSARLDQRVVISGHSAPNPVGMYLL